MSTILEDFLSTSKQLEQDALLHLLVTFDDWGDRGAKNIKNIFFFGELSDVFNVLLAQTWFLFFCEQANDTGGDNLSSESASGHTHVDIGSSPVDTSHFDTVARLDAIDKIVLEDHLHAPWQLARWCTFRHFLNRDDLGVFVETVAVLVSQSISVLVLHWEVLRASC